MLIDTHSHLNFNAYNKDVNDVVERCLANDVWMINVGSQYATSKKAVEIAEKYPQGVYGAIGLHPIHLETNLVKIKEDPEEIQQFQDKEENFNYDKYKNLACGKNLDSRNARIKEFTLRSLGEGRKVVAIGEIGLDYYYKPKTKVRLEIFKKKQKEALDQQIKLAQELDLPVIFHCRMAHQDLIEILKSLKSKPEGVIHCFTGNWQQAEQYLEMGFYLGFNGIIFKMNLDEIIKKTPLDKILIETDCPYLTPPNLEIKRNEPIYVKYVAERIAELRNLNFQEIADITTQNAKELFGIK